MRQQTFSRRAAVATLAIAAGLASATATNPARADDPYFKGKTVSLMVGFGAGGGVDLAARVFARYAEKHIPGNPSVIVKSMPGAGSMKMQNFVFERAKGDGQTLMYGPWFPVNQLLKAPGMRVKYEKFKLVGGISTAGYFFYARTDIVPGGLKSAADLVKAKNVRFGGGTPYSTFDLIGRLALEMLGVSHKYVPGYFGSAAMRASVMKNEANVACDSATVIKAALQKSMIDTGIAKVLWSYPELDEKNAWQRNHVLPNTPTLLEVYEQINGKKPSGPRWEALNTVMGLMAKVTHSIMAPPSTPDAVVAELRKGFHGVFADPAFKAEFNKRFGYVAQAVPDAEAQRIVTSLDKVDPQVIAYLQEHVQSGRKAFIARMKAKKKAGQKAH